MKPPNEPVIAAESTAALVALNYGLQFIPIHTTFSATYSFSAKFYFTTQISITTQINTERLLSSYLSLTVYLSPLLCFFFNKYNTIMPTLLEMMIARVALRPFYILYFILSLWATRIAHSERKMVGGRAQKEEKETMAANINCDNFNNFWVCLWLRKG